MSCNQSRRRPRRRVIALVSAVSAPVLTLALLPPTSVAAPVPQTPVAQAPAPAVVAAPATVESYETTVTTRPAYVRPRVRVSYGYAAPRARLVRSHYRTTVGYSRVGYRPVVSGYRQVAYGGTAYKARTRQVGLYGEAQTREFGVMSRGARFGEVNGGRQFRQARFEGRGQLGARALRGDPGAVNAETDVTTGSIGNSGANRGMGRPGGMGRF